MQRAERATKAKAEVAEKDSSPVLGIEGVGAGVGVGFGVGDGVGVGVGVGVGFGSGVGVGSAFCSQTAKKVWSPSTV